MNTKLIEQATRNGPGTLKINTKPTSDPTFHVEGLLVQISLNITNNGEDSQTYTVYEHLLSKLKILWADNKPFWNDVSLFGTDKAIMALAIGVAGAPNSIDDVVFTAGQSKTIDINFRIPVRLEVMARPADFDQSFDMFGLIEVNIPAPTVSDLDLEDFSVAVVAHGHRDQNRKVKVGTRYQVWEPICTGDKADDTALGGDVALLFDAIVSQKSDKSTTAYNGITMKIDSQLPIVDLPNAALKMAQIAFGDSFRHESGLEGLETFVKAATFFAPRMGTAISELPHGSKLSRQYGTSTAAKGDFAYLTMVIEPPHAQAALAVIPGLQRAIAQHGGAGNLGAVGILARPTLSGTAANAAAAGRPVPDRVAKFLPLEFSLPENQ